MKILFLHGWNSVPGGAKPRYLAQHGHVVINPALSNDDFALAVSRAQQAFDKESPDVIAGSSRGGAVAMNLQSGSTPLLLLCPAWKRWGTARAMKQNSAILHSRQDEVIPFENSEELIRHSRLPAEALVEVGSDHRLADETSLSVMLWVCQLLTSGEPLPWLDDPEESDRRRLLASKAAMQEESSYICDACGEEIIIPLDLTEGATQTYLEDCPVCCRCNIIHVAVNENGDAGVWAEPEQDYE